MTDWPIRDPAKLSDCLRGWEARDPTDVVVVTLHRSELAILRLSLDTLAAQDAMKSTQEAVERNAHQRPSLADCEASWNDHQDEPTLAGTPKSGYLHDFPSLQVDAGADELLRELKEKSDDAWSDIIRTYDPYATIGSNGRIIFTEARASTRPKEYGQGQYGPVEIRRPGWPASACGPKTPSCLPAFGILGSTPDIDASTGSSAGVAAPHTDRTAAARTRSVRRGLGET